MIGNVFYNMLNQIAQKEQDPKFTDMADQIKTLMQTRSLDNLTGAKVPHMK